LRDRLARGLAAELVQAREHLLESLDIRRPRVRALVHPDALLGSQRMGDDHPLVVRYALARDGIELAFDAIGALAARRLEGLAQRLVLVLGVGEILLDPRLHDRVFAPDLLLGEDRGLAKQVIV